MSKISLWSGCRVKTITISIFGDFSIRSDRYFVNVAGARSQKDVDIEHKLGNSLGNYLVMHHFVTGIWTHVHISVAKWHIVGYGQVHFGISELG